MLHPIHRAPQRATHTPTPDEDVRNSMTVLAEIVSHLSERVELLEARNVLDRQSYDGQQRRRFDGPPA